MCGDLSESSVNSHMSNNVSKSWSAREWSAVDWSDDEGEGLIGREVPFFQDFERFIRLAYQDNANVGIVFGYQLDLGNWTKLFNIARKRLPPVDKAHLYKYFKEHVAQDVEKHLNHHLGFELLYVEFYSLTTKSD